MRRLRVFSAKKPEIEANFSCVAMKAKFSFANFHDLWKAEPELDVPLMKIDGYI